MDSAGWPQPSWTNRNTRTSISKLQLAHAPRNAVSAAYNHALHLKGRTKMMQDWAELLEQAQRGAKLLAFREVGA